MDESFIQNQNGELELPRRELRPYRIITMATVEIAASAQDSKMRNRELSIKFLGLSCHFARAVKIVNSSAEKVPRRHRRSAALDA